ncbi:CDC42 small effector protein 1 [Lemmus lemmus]
MQKKRRRRIDRTMIGEPMNFVHLTHIGSGEMGAGDGLAMVIREGRVFIWGCGQARDITEYLMGKQES